MKKYKKTIIFLVIFGAFFGYLIFRQTQKPKTEYVTADVERGRLNQTVSATGELKDDSEMVLNFEIGGRVGKIFVKRGDKVAQGDRIASLEDQNLSSLAVQAKTVLDRALAEAGSSDDLIREAEVSEKNAKNILEETESFEKQKVDAAEKAFSNANDYYQDAKKVYEETPTSINKLTLTAALNARSSAEENLKTVKRARDLAVASGEASLLSAKARTETARSDFSKKSRNSAVESARAGYEIALNNLSKAVLKAPASGTIVEINNKPGEILGTGVIKESFARLIADDFIIESNIPESDISKIKTGQIATVSFDAFGSGDVFEAEVAEIAPAENVIQGVTYYAIKLRIAVLDPRLKPGMSANVDILAAEKENVLMIPIRAVKTENGEKFADVLDEDGTVRRVKIGVGLEGDEGMVEVKNGLQEGEKVITFERKP